MDAEQPASDSQTARPVLTIVSWSSDEKEQLRMEIEALKARLAELEERLTADERRSAQIES